MTGSLFTLVGKDRARLGMAGYPGERDVWRWLELYPEVTVERVDHEKGYLFLREDGSAIIKTPRALRDRALHFFLLEELAHYLIIGNATAAGHSDLAIDNDRREERRVHALMLIWLLYPASTCPDDELVVADSGHSFDMVKAFRNISRN